MAKIIFTSIFLGLLFSCSPNLPETVNPGDLQLKWELVENQFDGKPQYKARFTLINTSSLNLGKDWSIYFNQIAGSTILDGESEGLKLSFLMGTFFNLAPTAGFSGLKAGDSLVFDYVAAGMIGKNAQAPQGAYIVSEDGKATALRGFSAKELTLDDPQVVKIVSSPLPEAGYLYEKNQDISLIAAPRLPKILPTPLDVKVGRGSFTLQTPLTIYFESGLEREADFLKAELSKLLQGEVVTREGRDQSLQLKLRTTGDPESYTLSVNTAGIQITGTDAAGVFYGLQSLRALLPVGLYQSPAASIAVEQLTIEDSPRYRYRGMHLDMARNFISKEAVIKLMNLMAFYKLNYLHMHLTEDEAWRLEIPGLPELTEIGARRGHTLTEDEFLHPEYGSGPDPNDPASPGNGHYSKADFMEILKHAESRHIRVIPEIDIPGHSRAAIVAMKSRYNRLMKEGKTEEANQYALHDPEDKSEYLSIQNFPDNVICVCRPSALTFMEKVFDEIIAMYREAEVPLESIHIGGDEVPKGVWEKSPICNAFMNEHPELTKTHDLMPYFIGQLINMLQAKGMPTSGWQEIAMREAEGGGEEVNPEFAETGMRPYVWIPSPDLANRLANAGYEPVISNASKLYFDLAYNNDPAEPGQTWAGLVNTRTAWEIVPENIFYSSEVDDRGNPFNPAEKTKAMVKLSPEGEKNLLGLQGQLWTETVKNPDMMEHYVFPKLLGLAERAWSPAPAWATTNDLRQRQRARETAWNVFVNTVGQKEMPRLDYLEGGVNYRIPRPGAKIENGQLLVNVEYPGLVTRYTTDGSEPTATSAEWTGPVAVDGPVMLKSFDSRGRSGLSSVVSPGEQVQIER